MKEALVTRPFGEPFVQGHDRVAVAVDRRAGRDPTTVTEKEVTGGSHCVIVTRPVVIVNGPVYIFCIVAA
jgi:hypothetical protein